MRLVTCTIVFSVASDPIGATPLPAQSNVYRHFRRCKTVRGRKTALADFIRRPTLARRSFSPNATFWGLGKLRAPPIAYGFMITAVLAMVNRLGYENDIVCFDPSIGISFPGSKLNTSSIVFPAH